MAAGDRIRMRPHLGAARGLAGEYAVHTLTAHSHPMTAVWAAWFVRWALTLLFPGGLVCLVMATVVDQVLAPEHLTLWLSASATGDQTGHIWLGPFFL